MRVVQFKMHSCFRTGARRRNQHTPIRELALLGHCLDSSGKSMESLGRKKEFFLGQKKTLTQNIFANSDLDLKFLVQEERREEEILTSNNFVKREKEQELDFE